MSLADADAIAAPQTSPVARPTAARPAAARTDRWSLVTPLALLVIAFAVIPAVGSDYWFSAILIPFLALSLAGLGLNLLTGYAGQLSLGSSAFMAVGAFTAYNFILRVPH